MSGGADEARKYTKNVHGDLHAKAREIDAAVKQDHGKPPIGLLPTLALEEISRAFEFGANKYGRFNWCKGFHWSRLIDSSYRHLGAWSRGEDKDSQSNLSHLTHLAACVIMLIEHELRGLGTDDRYKWKEGNTHDRNTTNSGNSPGNNGD